MSDVIYTSANPGENVHNFYRRVLIEAYSTNQTVRGTFNDISVNVNPRSHLEDILIIWNLRMSSYKK